MQQYVDKAWRRSYSLLIDKDDDFEVFGTFYNYFFINMSAMLIIAERTFGTNGNELMDQYYGQRARSVVVPNRDKFWKQLKIRLKGPLLVYDFFFALDKKVEKSIQSIKKTEQSFMDTDWARLSDEALRDKLKGASEDAIQAMSNHLTSSAIICLPISLLEKIVAPYSENPKNDVNLLVSGLKNVESSQISLRIWTLSRIARQHRLKIGAGFDP